MRRVHFDVASRRRWSTRRSLVGRTPSSDGHRFCSSPDSLVMSMPVPHVRCSQGDRHNTPQRPVPDRTPRPNLQRADILLVDDDPCVLEGLADFIDLRLPNVSVMTCLSGKAALELTTVSNFHAIITDVRMPDMDGLTLMHRIHKLRPTTPVIVLTGHGDHTLRARALDTGAFAFLTKPLDREAFIAALQRAIADCRFQDKDQS